MATPADLSTTLMDMIKRQGFSGDIFAASQLGGIAGGHGNINTTINGGEETMRVKLERMNTMLAKEAVEFSEFYTSLGELEEMKETLEGFMEDVDSLIERLEKKLRV
ncbi:hypothetical protein EYR40_004849 [Pleurotus pulmonarius]|nr:hypothetical protein EYR36_006770 [Pleurotus pulmonarius]KAF4601466.1 hypothetical protein EYR38_006119 [Pleurotus pulmonarius]KAF4601650.1 hypothetical protein EYR40_004849 [Pleurotus pulmonarius]